MYTGEVRRIKIYGTPNRKGLIFEVLKAIADYGINIVTMESDPYICCKLEWNENISELDFLMFMKKRVPTIEEIIYIDLMDYERIELELSLLLNNVDCAIVKADVYGKIVSYNDKGKRLLIRGKREIDNISNLLGNKNIEIDDNMESTSIEFSSIVDGDEKALFAEINPIKNEQGTVTGIFVIIKEMSIIRNLINKIMRPSMITFDNILGDSIEIKRAINMAKSVSKSDASIMLRGESGTGKELFARAIHMESDRAKGPFIAVNCSSIPETLIESEFFGYEKGAFTGANTSGKQGFFEQAIGGTLFLDEIGELATHLQAKILRALQEHKIRRIGGKHEIEIDVRIISATHRNLEKMVENKAFRADLYYRLNIIPIYIPPLREREGDIELLSNYFIKYICEKNGKPEMIISQEAMQKLLSFNWPGNVRELNNVLERAVFVAENQIEEIDIMLNNISDSTNEELIGGLKTEEFPIDLPKKIESIEQKYINKAMKEFKSYRKAAENLNISHTSVKNKYKCEKKT